MSLKAKPRKRRKLKVGAVLILLSLLLAICLGGFYLYRRITLIPKANSAFIYDLLENKEVHVIRDGKDSKAYRGMRLEVNDIVYTDNYSKVFIKLDENKNVLLNYGSEIKVEEYGQKSLILKLNKGQFFFDVTSKLDPNEKMSFKIANTTMSIRGTSGAGENLYNNGKLMIFTGKGEIESKNANDNTTSTFTLLPSTKVSFKTDNTGSTISELEVSLVENKDIPSVMNDYLNYQKNYQEELEDNNWINNTPPETIEGDAYIGWRQREDGTWYFSKEDYDAHIGPTYYLSARPNDMFALDSIYNGAIQEAMINNYNPVSMKIENGQQKDAGTYEVKVLPIYTWSDGSKTPYILNWTIKPKELNIEIENTSKEYKSKDPSFNSTMSGLIEGDSFKYKLVREKGEDLGSYLIYPEWDKEKYPNYEPVYNEAKLSIYTTFSISAKEDSYSYYYDGMYHGPDEPVEASDTNGTSYMYSLDGINWSNEVSKVINTGVYTVKVKAINERYTYEPECTYKIEITPSKAEVRAKGYYNQNSIEMIAEVQVPPNVEFTASYILYEINDYRLNKNNAQIIPRIVANGTYIAYPNIQILDQNFSPIVKYTKITVRSMLFRMYTNDYYDSISELMQSYSPE